MSNDELKKLFSAVDGVSQDEARNAEARSKALAAAMAAFDETQAASSDGIKGENVTSDQGSGNVHRLTSDTQTVGSNTMNHTITDKRAFSTSQRWLYSGLASAALLVVAVMITVQVPQHSGFDDNLISGTSKSNEITLLEKPGKKKFDDGSRQLQLEEVIVTARPNIAESELPAATNYRAKQESSALAPNRSIAKEQTTLSAVSAPMSIAISDRAEILHSPHYQDTSRDQFETVATNAIKRVSEAPISTFSIDVDTSSYSFVRRQLTHGILPQKAAVRLEEMVNYFPYDYPLPDNRDRPFSTHLTVLDSPWKAGNKLIHVGIKGYELQGAQPRSNLVLLLDVSGSMNSPDKLPLVKQSMSLLLSRLQPEDTVAIVVYAGAAGMVLEPTPASNKQQILAALNRLNAGGSTAGADGIKLAYQLAEANFVKDGVNRILLATDGDFNVGISDREELKGLVERKRQSGVFLSVLGFGQGNYNDHLMQTLAQNGNGAAAYIDTLSEAQKVLVDEATSSLFPIAKDVKIQMEFNPATVSEYRLLGYETRALAQEDFNNDAVDAGDIGAGHTVTAIYEITPVGSDSGVFGPSRYSEVPKTHGKGNEYGFLKLRYKLPEEDSSRLISQSITEKNSTDSKQLHEAHFATAVAGFAQLLQGGKYTADWTYADALTLAQAHRGEDSYGYRAEFVQLIRKAEIADAM